MGLVLGSSEVELCEVVSGHVGLFGGVLEGMSGWMSVSVLIEWCVLGWQIGIGCSLWVCVRCGIGGEMSRSDGLRFVFFFAVSLDVNDLFNA